MELCGCPRTLRGIGSLQDDFSSFAQLYLVMDSYSSFLTLRISFEILVHRDILGQHEATQSTTAIPVFSVRLFSPLRKWFCHFKFQGHRCQFSSVAGRRGHRHVLNYKHSESVIKSLDLPALLLVELILRNLLRK